MHRATSISLFYDVSANNYPKICHVFFLKNGITYPTVLRFCCKLDNYIGASIDLYRSIDWNRKPGQCFCNFSRFGVSWYKIWRQNPSHQYSNLLQCHNGVRYKCWKVRLTNILKLYVYVTTHILFYIPRIEGFKYGIKYVLFSRLGYALRLVK